MSTAWGWVTQNTVQYPNINVLDSITTSVVNTSVLYINGVEFNGEIPENVSFNNLTVSNSTNLNGTVSVNALLTLVSGNNMTIQQGDLNIGSAIINYDSNYLGQGLSGLVINSNVIVPGTSYFNNQNVLGGLTLNNLGLPGYTTTFTNIGVTNLFGSTTINNLTVSGTTSLNQTLTVSGNTTLSPLTVNGALRANQALTVSGQGIFSNTLTVKSDTNLDNNLTVSGIVTLHSFLTVTGIATLNSTILFDKFTTITNSLTVNNDLTIGQNLTVTGNTTVSNLTVSGNLSVNGDLTFNNLDVASGIIDTRLFVGLQPSDTISSVLTNNVYSNAPLIVLSGLTIFNQTDNSRFANISLTDSFLVLTYNYNGSTYRANLGVVGTPSGDPLP